MKIRNLAIAIALLFACAEAKAQDKATSLNLGFSPFGIERININYGDEKYKYDYKSYWNANIGLEKQFKGAVSLTEISYAQAKFDKYDLTNPSTKWFNPAQEDDIFIAAFTQYIGKTINPNKRVQFPLYIGIGGEYISGGQLHNITGNLAAKARFKFYITNNIGIYAGVTGKVGYGMKAAHDDNDKSSKEYYDVIPFTFAADAGLVIGL